MQLLRPCSTGRMSLVLRPVTGNWLTSSSTLCNNMDPGRRRLPRYKDQVTDNDNDRHDLPLNIPHSPGLRRRVAVEAPSSIEHTAPQQLFPTFKDQVNVAVDQNLRLQNRENDNVIASRRSVIAVPSSPAGDVGTEWPQQQRRANHDSPTTRLPDFKDQARSTTQRRQQAVAAVTVVDTAMLPTYKDQVIGEMDHRRRMNTLSPILIVSHDSLPQLQPQHYQSVPNFKDQVQSALHIRNDTAAAAAMESNAMLPNYKDQVYDGRNDADRLLMPTIKRATKVKSKPQQHSEQHLPDTRAASANVNDSDESDLVRRHHLNQLQHHTESNLITSTETAAVPMGRLPCYKDQIQSVLPVQIRAEKDDVINSSSRPSQYTDQVLVEDDHLLLPTTKATPKSRSPNPDALPNYKDQVQSVVPVQVRATDVDVDSTSRLPQYEDQVFGEHDRHGNLPTETASSTSPVLSRNPAALPDYKDQAQSILPVQIRETDAIVVDSTRLPQYKDQVIGEHERHGHLPPKTSSTTPTISRNPALPDYKDQVQTLSPVQISSTDVVDSTRLPMYKEQVPGGSLQSTQHVSNATTAAALSQNHTLPEYKDQAQSILQANATEDTVVDSTRLPQYKDQALGENEGRMSSVSPTAKMSATRRSVVQGDDPVECLPSYKDQALGEEAHRSGLRLSMSGISKDTTPTTATTSLSSVQSNDVNQSRRFVDTDQDESTTSAVPPTNETSNIDTNIGFIREGIDQATMAFAEPYVEVPVYHATSDPIVPQGGVSYAEGVGVLVDIVFDNDEEPSPEGNNEAQPSDAGEKSSEPVQRKYLGFQSRRTMLWVLGGVMLLIVGVVGGGICGSGACSLTGSTSLPSGSTNISPIVDYPIPFSNTNELYVAVDEFMDAFYGDNVRETNVTTVYGSIADWDVSQLTNLALVFYGDDRTTWPGSDIDLSVTSLAIPRTLFNEDISRWNISAATTLEGMFAGAKSIGTNFDLSTWETSRVTTMRGMFHSASSYDGNLGNWNVQSVLDFTGMFTGCTAFTGRGLDVWNIESGQFLTNMFARASNFNVDLSGWKTDKVTSLLGTFQFCDVFQGAGLEGWNVSAVTSLERMLFNAVTFNIDLSRWDTSRVTNLRRTFDTATIFNSALPWDVSQVTSMSGTFNFAQAFSSDIGLWDTSQCTDMSEMLSSTFFDGNVSMWNTGRVVRMNNMFESTSRFNSNIGQWNVSSVITMSRMFRYATAFNQDLSGWDIRQVTEMDGMFQYAPLLSQNLCDWGTLLTERQTPPPPPPTLVDIFSGTTSCESSDTPDIQNITVGPWCAATCTS